MVVVANHHHRQPVARCGLWRLGAGRGSYGLGWGLWLGGRLWWRMVERRLGRRLRWWLWCRLGSAPSPLECWLESRLGWGCLRLDVVGLAVLTAD
jgi:hypothetical protein